MLSINAFENRKAAVTILVLAPVAHFFFPACSFVSIPLPQRCTGTFQFPSTLPLPSPVSLLRFHERLTQAIADLPWNVAAADTVREAIFIRPISSPSHEHWPGCSTVVREWAGHRQGERLAYAGLGRGHRFVTPKKLSHRSLSHSFDKIMEKSLLWGVLFPTFVL